MNSDHESLELIRRYIDGITKPEEITELQDIIRRDAVFRKLFARYTSLDSALGDGRLSVAPVTRVQSNGSSLPSLKWLSWRPLTAAAVGIALGIFCTSVVFAYVAPSLGKVTKLLQESFESESAPLVTGVPMDAGHWSGDYTEVVGEQQGVKPESGERMLRFLRADYEGKANAEGSRVCDLYRLIDMRPHRAELADDGAVVQLSAGFNTFELPADELHQCSLTLYALDAESVKNGSTRSSVALNEVPIGSQKMRMKMDRNPATWQRLTSELRLPPDTDYLLVRICIQHTEKPAPQQTFSGHYLDDVRLTMARRNPLP